ncbi:YjfB family protein [Evansella cellulosilytica]|nr:YjfB family protein [Evansella cellulosilytica]
MLSMGMSQAYVKQEASMAMMKKAMGSAEQNGDFVSKMLEGTQAPATADAPHPYLGGKIDVKL